MLYQPRTPIRDRRGFVLIAVLVVVVLLTLAAFQFSEFMMAEYKANDSFVRSAQARALAESGAHYLAAMICTPDNITSLLGGNIYDNPSVFQDVAVNGSGPFQGRFSIVSPYDPDQLAAGSQGFRFGVTDESGKINLNTLLQLDSSGNFGHDMLLKIPALNSSEDVVNSILDWLDGDQTERTGGAEDSFYQSMSPPYHAKNGPLDSMEELLLVKGVTPQLLLGNDRNRNGTLDPNEDDGSGTSDPGLSGYLTVYSRELNVDSTGNQRVYINAQDLNQLSSDLGNAGLSDDLVSYILAYRIYGPTSSSNSTPTIAVAFSSDGKTVATTVTSSPTPSSTPSPPASSGSGGNKGGTGAGGANGGKVNRQSLNLNNKRNRSISSLYELINSQVSIPSTTPNGQPTIYPSPLNDPSSISTLLPQLLDKTTTRKNLQIPARINVNTAPMAVLETLPGLSDTDLESIIDNRPSQTSGDMSDPTYQTTTWLITQANIKPSVLQSLDRYITTHSQVYRAQVVGYFDRGGPTSRVEVVIDTNLGYPRIVYQRELSELGKGFALTPPSQ